MVLDTNVLVSALIKPGALPDKLLQHWEADDFTLVTSSVQLDELQRVLAYDKLQKFIHPDQAAKLVENIRSFAVLVEDLPEVNASTDPADNLILATAMAGSANHLVTGDKADLLNLKSVNDVAIISVRDAIQLLAAESAG
jgi:putative PIN family toxin of toxin-antitoxin system